MSKPDLSTFFETWYLRNRLHESVESTIASYRDVLRLWDQIFKGVPIDQITDWHLLTFQKAIAIRPGLKGEKLSPNTVRAKLRHVMTILTGAGPQQKGRALSANMIATVPWVPLPRAVYHDPQPARIDDVVAVYNLANQARFPKECNAEVFWQALLSVALSTGLRYVQLMRLKWSMVAWDESQLRLPAEINRKSRRDEVKPLHELAVSNLAKMPQDHEQVFYHAHDWRTLYRELDRLEYLAGIPKERAFHFHDIRRLVLLEVCEINSAAAVALAGHQNILMTSRHYVNSRNAQRAVNGLDFWHRFQGSTDEETPAVVAFQKQG